MADFHGMPTDEPLSACAVESALRAARDNGSLYIGIYIGQRAGRPEALETLCVANMVDVDIDDVVTVIIGLKGMLHNLVREAGLSSLDLMQAEMTGSTEHIRARLLRDRN